MSAENASSNKQTSRSNGGRGGAKKKSSGGSTKGKGEDIEKKSGGVTKAVQKKIDAWWQRNSDALVKITAEQYYWVDFSADTVKAYKQFIQVKREMQDWENKLLPCLAVGSMIASHEKSKDFDYQADMKLLCGHDFGGEELIVCEKVGDYDREIATFEAVQKRFGSEFDENLWSTVAVSIAEVEGGMKWNLGDRTNACFAKSVQRSNTLESAFEAYALSGGDPDTVGPVSHLFRFLHLRTQEVLDPTDTALGLRFSSYSDVIFALCKNETLIEVKKRGSDSSAFHLFLAANQTETMSKALNDLVNDDGDETDYVYMYKGRRLYSFETPMALQMKHFDIIDAIPLQDYKYKRCTCCNNVHDEGHLFSTTGCMH